MQAARPVHPHTRVQAVDTTRCSTKTCVALPPYLPSLVLGFLMTVADTERDPLEGNLSLRGAAGTGILMQPESLRCCACPWRLPLWRSILLKK